jgi:phospholipid/cholesterol/gamma-HCH transport system substrate-binding protein
MNERKMQIWVGLMVLMTLLVTGSLVVMFGNLPKLFYGTYKVAASFEKAPGVAVGTPVRKSGIRIGRVVKVAMNESNTEVIVTLEIENEWKVYSNEVCRAQSNLLGDAFLEFVRLPGKRAMGEQLTNGVQIRGQSFSDPLQMVQSVQGQFTSTIDSVRNTSESFRGTSDDLRETLVRLNAMLDENKKGIKTAIQQANEILGDTREIVGDENTKKNLHAAIQELPQMIKDTHDTVLVLRQAVQTVDKNFRNLERFTEPLGDRGAVLVGNLEKGTRNLDALVSDLSTFTEKLNSSEGTIGALINDPALYQHLTRAAKNIDEITRELKPIKDDLRVFTDKIARHPESLGARGIFEKKAGIK